MRALVGRLGAEADTGEPPALEGFDFSSEPVLPSDAPPDLRGDSALADVWADYACHGSADELPVMANLPDQSSASSACSAPPAAACAGHAPAKVTVGLRAPADLSKRASLGYSKFDLDTSSDDERPQWQQAAFGPKRRPRS